jgi:hypothetical protein
MCNCACHTYNYSLPLPFPLSFYGSTYLLVSKTYLPAIFPSCIRSNTFCNSLNPTVLKGALISPRLKNSIASALSRRLPTYEPLMVIIFTTDSNTGARRYAPAGRPMATIVPRGRTYCMSTCQLFPSNVTLKRRTSTNLGCLLERLFVDCNQYHGVWSESVFSSSMNVRN